MIARFAACPSPMSGMLLEHFHGAATRPAATDTAFPHRTTGFNLLVAGEWMSPADSAANIGWTRDTYAAMSAHFAAGRYANYLNTDELADQNAVAAAFGPNAARLREIKRRVDPDNVFRHNQNIKP
jgi:FAD/FMN-containing dehydrogenase